MYRLTIRLLSPPMPANNQCLVGKCFLSKVAYLIVVLAGKGSAGLLAKGIAMAAFT